MLSDTEIIEQMKNGNIVIEPFNPGQLGPNSYDVRLGPWFYAPSEDGPRKGTEPLTVVDFTLPWEVERYWVGPRESYDVIYIGPRETLLCHTQEVIGGRNGYLGEMRARSSIGRSCLAIAKCAGMGDVGYINKWTMEITNFSDVCIPLYVGMRVGQIVFHRVEGKVSKEYAGSYGQGDWTPEDMLPKLRRA